jgi:glycosyltransferase involved in cell wall biosynthesis
LVKQKGFSHLIDAFVLLRKVIPAHLWIIGEGELRQELEAKVACLGLGNCVRLLGFQSNPYKFMAAADVFALSSLWEGFGNVIVEAMACGVPVVASDCLHGPAEIITNGVNGLLVPPSDDQALSRAMLRVLTDQALRERLSANGRARAEDFQARTIASAYERLFLSLSES